MHNQSSSGNLQYIITTTNRNKEKEFFAGLGAKKQDILFD